MVKRMISQLSVLAVLIVFMAACSKKAEYIHVIPADASAVASINLNSLADKAGLNDKPVSYTHLRAHETRGNLVCRLLL